MQFIDLLIYLLLIAFAIVYDFYVVLVLLLLIPLPLLSTYLKTPEVYPSKSLYAAN